ncbi:MAG: transcriptional regulator [Anaerolineae bacterium]|nr:transcriptional regulator [Anaerolineae bacterium]
MAIGTERAALLYKQMPVTRRRILHLFKENGELTADQLAKLLDISTVAVRRHLTRLERDNLVTYEEMRRGMGRPSFVYRLGEAASSYFPRGYDELAVTVLKTIEDLYGREAVDAVFRMRSEHLLEKYRQKVNGQSLPVRLEQLVKLREADGYMSTWKLNADGTYTLRETNCPIVHVAENCGSACDYDHALLTNLLKANVVRISHLASGDSACCYQVRPKPNSEQ